MEVGMNRGPTRRVSPFAGKSAEPSMLVDVPRLVTAYFAERPDPAIGAQRVAFAEGNGSREKSIWTWFCMEVKSLIQSN